MTPLTELTRFGRRIFAKHEYGGTTGSMKDRMVERALRSALANGELRAGMELVEASSGNTGAALAASGSELGFVVQVFVSSRVSHEKKEMIRAFGGNVIEVDGGTEIARAAEYARGRDAYLFNQFENPYHVPAYRETIGAEVVAQLAELGVTVDHFVGGLGSGGSIRAVGEMLREHHNPQVKIWAVVPSVSPSDIEGLHPGHLRPEGHFKIWLDRAPGFESGVIECTDEDAFRQIIELRDEVSVGPASGAVLHVARHLPEPGNVLIVLTDIGKKYLLKIAAWEAQI